MEPVKSTARIVFFKALNKDFNRKLLEQWAIDMMLAGCDNEDVVTLAGDTDTYSQGELSQLVGNAFNSLEIDYSNIDRAITKYISYLIDAGRDNGLSLFTVLEELTDVHMALNYNNRELDSFYQLYNAKVDFLYGDSQYYWDGATKDNIDEIVLGCFNEWKANHS